MKYIATKLWIYFLRPIWSFIVNLGYWIINLHNLKDALEVKSTIKDLPLARVLDKFIWTQDGAKDWIPWIITITNRKWKDDCDGSAVLAHYWYKKNGIKSTVLNLYDKDITVGHCICMRDDHTEFTTNNSIVKITKPVWSIELFAAFNNTYSRIL